MCSLHTIHPFDVHPLDVNNCVHACSLLASSSMLALFTEDVNYNLRSVCGARPSQIFWHGSPMVYWN